MTTKLSDEQLREIVRHGFIFHGAPDNLSAMAEELLSLRELERRVLAAPSATLSEATLVKAELRDYSPRCLSMRGQTVRILVDE